MLISETFHSLQGEGSLIGMPSFFLRTSGCNLRCSWCDTPYASWNPTGTEMSIAEILSLVDKTPVRHIVLTGGEPMVAKGIHDLARELDQRGLHITIETAGTIPPQGIACHLASLSPKLAHSTPSKEQAGPWSARHEATRWQPDVLRAWMDHCDFQLKFVVRHEADVREIIELLERDNLTPLAQHIMLMPEGIDAKKLHATAPIVAELCKQHGFRYTPRLHIDLYGNTRGT